MSRVTWQPSNTREEWAPTAAASAVLEDRVRARARKKMNLPPGPQDSSYTSNDLHYARDHAQREGADNRIDATVLQENAFAGEVQKLNVQLRSASLLCCQPDHPRVGFECIDLAHPRGIVVKEACARAYADLREL